MAFRSAKLDSFFIMNKILRIPLAIIATLAVIVGYGLAISIGSLTFCPRWIVWTVCIVLSAALGLHTWRLWSGILGTDRMWFNYLVNLVAFTGIFCGGFYAVNYWGRGALVDDTTTRYTIERTASETRTRPKRTGRRVTGQETYRVYKAYYTMADSTRRAVTLNVGEFAKTRPGDKVDVTVSTGFFGLKVISSQKVIHVKRKKARGLRRS